MCKTVGWDLRLTSLMCYNVIYAAMFESMEVVLKCCHNLVLCVKTFWTRIVYVAHVYMGNTPELILQCQDNT